jgi:DNA-binding MarR family transcriptional regulator
MSALMINESLDFNNLKETLGVTDGNLASHLKSLEQNNLIRVSKKFIGKKPNTSFSVTEYGAQLFREHLKALEDIINSQ